MPKTFVVNIYASTLIPLVPACLIVCLRIYARRITNLKLWWDDWLAVLALVSCVVYDVYTLHTLRYGFGRHLADIRYTADQARYYLFLLQAVEEYTYTVAIGAAQLSLLALYWRLFKDIGNVFVCVFILLGCTVIWIIARLFITIFQCTPPAYLWDKSIEGGECSIHPDEFFLGTVSAHLMVDLALIALPASQIWKLNRPFAQKAAIGVMFAFGIVVCIASIMMIITSTAYDSTSPEVMWNSARPAAWSSAEIHLSVISCCLPLMRPVIRGIGGWWSQIFASRKSSAVSTGSVKLGSVRKSVRMNRIIKSESTTYDTHGSVNENTQIGGQGEE